MTKQQLLMTGPMHAVYHKHGYVGGHQAGQMFTEVQDTVHDRTTLLQAPGDRSICRLLRGKTFILAANVWEREYSW